jgi:hypothetical protein
VDLPGAFTELLLKSAGDPAANPAQFPNGNISAGESVQPDEIPVR